MSYSAKTVYRDDKLANAYEDHRFRSWSGRLAGDLEKSTMLAGLKHLGAGPNALVLDVPEKILLVDFDVTQSFGHKASGWVMDPVVTGGELQAQ